MRVCQTSTQHGKVIHVPVTEKEPIGGYTVIHRGPVRVSMLTKEDHLKIALRPDIVGITVQEHVHVRLVNHIRMMANLGCVNNNLEKSRRCGIFILCFGFYSDVYISVIFHAPVLMRHPQFESDQA